MACAVCLIAMFFAAGGHWAALQTVAWSRMLIDYSRTTGLATALSDTFDGEHPCPMCKKIASARQAEKRSPLQAPARKVAKPPELFCSILANPIQPPVYRLQAWRGHPSAAAAQFRDTPPTPPPV